MPVATPLFLLPRLSFFTLQTYSFLSSISTTRVCASSKLSPFTTTMLAPFMTGLLVARVAFNLPLPRAF